jgi:anti-sigma factor RsiW
MAHLGERITDYIFEELPAAELAEAKAHVAQCGECKSAVEHFQRTRSLLKAVPDVDPPRSAELVFEKPRVVRSWTWKWLAPMAAAAAILVIALLVPIQVQWQDSQLTIALGAPPVAGPSDSEQQTAAKIQELQAQLKGLYDLQQGQERDFWAALTKVDDVLARRSSPVGD